MPGLEPGERAFALVLGQVSVHRHCGNVLAGELADELVGAVLRADEDEREPALGVEVLDEAVELPLGGHRHERVLDRSGPAVAR